MPDFLPDGGEAGTLNVPGIAGLHAGMHYVDQVGSQTIAAREYRQTIRCVAGLKKLGFKVFSGPHQAGVVSFVAPKDCQEAADILARQGIAVRAGLHCAPLAHRTAGTLDTGTVRVSFGHNAEERQTDLFLQKARLLN
jgi:selenocysteine lyase/cysteine desulfurase